MENNIINNLQQPCYIPYENPVSPKVNGKTVFILTLITTFIPSLQSVLVDIFEIAFLSSDISALSISVLQIAISIAIGKKIYNTLLGATVFSGLACLARTLANNISKAILSPFFLFDSENSAASKAETLVSVILMFIFSVLFVHLYNKIAVSSEEYDDVSDVFPKKPVKFMIIAYLLSNIISVIPTVILSVINAFLVFESFEYDYATSTQSLNNILYVLTAICLLLQIAVYYLYIKKSYLTKKRTVSLIAMFFFSNVIANPFLNLYIMIFNFLSVEDSLIQMLLMGNSTLITFIINIICIIVFTKKFEPTIREV